METLRGYTYQAQQLGNRAIGFLNTDSLIPQLILTVLIVIAIHVVVMMMESVVGAVQSYNRLSATIVKDTIREQLIFNQSVDSTDAKLYPSNNELNGLEFSYSWHLYIDPANYGGTTPAAKYRNIWYKGHSDKPWPVLGPGVFLHPTDNKMRIYMNAVNTIDDMFVDIPNIPVGKWFHMVITQKGLFMDIYINGNIVKRHEFTSVPRINFGNVNIFSKTSYDETSNPFKVDGAMTGMLSRFKYYAYALNYAQIDDLYREGPSSKIETPTMDQTPPYFHDSWWVTRY
jgi:hypothetical protein